MQECPVKLCSYLVHIRFNEDLFIKLKGKLSAKTIGNTIGKTIGKAQYLHLVK